MILNTQWVLRCVSHFSSEALLEEVFCFKYILGGGAPLELRAIYSNCHYYFIYQI